MWEKIEDRNFSDTARFRNNETSISVSGPDEFMWHLTTEKVVCEYNTINLRWLVVEFNNEWSTMEPECRVMLGEVPITYVGTCLLYTSPSPRDRQKSRMPSSA